MRQQGFAPILILLGSLIILAIAVGAYYLGIVPNKLPSQNSAVTSQNKPSPTTPSLQGQIFSGQIKKLSQNLMLFSEKNLGYGPIPQSFSYYSAGVYTKGKYAGYTRYVAVGACSCQTGGPEIHVFASKDNKSYILDEDPALLTKFKPADSQYPLFFMDKKVTTVDQLDSEHINTIPLDSRFALSRNDIAASLIFAKGENNSPTGAKLLINFSSFVTLKSPVSNLTFYGQNPAGNYKYSISTTFPADKFIAGTTQIIVVDSTGLAYFYTPASPKLIVEYPKALADYTIAHEKYQNQPIQVGHPLTIPAPDYPQLPNLAMKASDIKTTSTIYSKYSNAIPQNCAFDANTLVVKNISDSDLSKIGTSRNGDIYVLKDKNHPLYKQEFDDKIDSIINDKFSKDTLETFKEINNNQSPPTYDEYIHKNPLILFKDYWGRWVVLGEYDYRLAGGCGKPVIYLYPTKPTKVSVKFLTPIKFDLTIPNYHEGWNVLAHPDGTLADLQPQFTDCNSIDSNKFGSEYAKGACINNTYPYLYWTGQSTEKLYPEITKGWIVERTNLSNFMNQTLDIIGFNSTEKSDFLSYWLPKMLSHNAPYFQVSFLQNPEMDEIAPMKVIPTPDHYYRYFLDYLPINSKPPGKIEPESLTKIVRHGFTLVEWGGHLF